ncbi:5'-methylthioadenosine/S-adenosylhomocysteine nucleosidase [Pelagibacterium xiamenense]|uniref:5'-methylthioadenosine/S-adenosylhomocysteine nucleosidase n=1 Tax=Pelagibacterium xiamenense TaxID=2901140 RepID=UPI001E4F1594|nr:5'-methylthioadenosine/S-adenosylhomocysteine nucleosidase [Pelagibacterium xiamenense]MCD7059943.1 5'-methylthioadenosine/S-adenosylhomocysteine nucleosidase [Pelagibacterium xiamenense]
MRILSTFAAALLMSAPVAAFAQELAPIEDTPRIAVMSAFTPEWIALQEALEGREDYEINGTTFVTGTIEGKEVVLFLSGISMVNAAMTTQMALDHFNVESIVFSGIAGGVDPELNLGDVVVADQWGQYLEAVFAREVDGTYAPPPFIPTSLPNYGMIFPREVDVAIAGGEIEQRFWFPVDPDLLETARQVAAEIDLLECVGENACLSAEPAVIVGGNGVSGQAFVDNADFREYVFGTFEAKVLDMESAAVAHVAYTNEVPFIAFRSLSDLAGGGEGENEMGTFMGLASDNSSAVVIAFLAALP